MILSGNTPPWSDVLSSGDGWSGSNSPQASSSSGVILPTADLIRTRGLHYYMGLHIAEAPSLPGVDASSSGVWF